MTSLVDDAVEKSNLDLEKRVLRKLYARIVAFCFLLFMINFLDRVNVSFAALTMNEELGLTPQNFGFGAGIFFFGYILFEIPSNLVLYRVGPRVWLARIMVTWGIIAGAMAFIQGPISFYVLRFLLGSAEAGFVPGVILYMTYWFPAKETGKAFAGFMLAVVLSSVIGAPLSGWLLDITDGRAGLSGWQWMFIIEAIPAIVIGIVTYFYLVDRPENGRWLDQKEQEWLAKELAVSNSRSEDHVHKHLGEAVKDGRVWALTAIYGLNALAMSGLILWMPQIIKGLGSLTNTRVGFIAAIPFLCAAIGMVLISANSDRTGERKLHLGLAGLSGGVFLAASAFSPSPIIGFVLLCFAASTLWATNSVFWTVPTLLLRGSAAAGGIALINSIAQIGGFAGPYLVGWVRGMTQDFSLSLIGLAVAPMLGFVICVLLPIKRLR